MASSGSKMPVFQGSIFYGSAEADDTYCDPCLADGHNEDTYGYCVDCEEHLCKHCFRCHKNSKLSRHHQLLDKGNMDKRPLPTKSSATITEMCPVHQNELIKFFCPRHEALGCGDCITLEHRRCKIDYIPEKCSGIGDSRMYKDTMKQMNDQVKQANLVARKAKAKDKQVKSFVSETLKDIDTFETEMIRRINELRKKVQREVRDKEIKVTQTIQKALQTCTNVSTDIQKAQSNMAAAKASDQEGQLYIFLVRARAALHSHAVSVADRSLDKLNANLKFQSNKDLNSYLSNSSTLGSLVTTENLEYDPKKLTVNTMNHVENIYVKTRTDTKHCDISGCAVLSSDTIVLADSENKKIKVVDTQKKTVVREKQLDTKLFDITVVPEDQIAVTLPDKKEILIIDSDSRLTTKSCIPVRQGCWGISYHGGCLYVLCRNPNCVLTLDLRGTVKYKFSLDLAHSFSSPLYIVCCKYNNLMYISDWNSNMVTSVTLLGEVTAVYRHKDLYNPHGMVAMEDGSLLVCCWNIKGNVYRISGDLKQGHIVVDSSSLLKCICFRGQVFIGSENCDFLRVCSLQNIR